MKKRLVEDHPTREKNIGFYWGTGKLAVWFCVKMLGLEPT